jgi:hypothetical protein
MQILDSIALVISLAVCFIFTGCPTTPMSVECKAFFSQPSSVQEKQFRTYDLEKQLDFYRCGMRRRPPESSLSILIAERGAPVVPVLLQKLEAEKDELFQYAIIDIFEVMSVKGQLRGRKDVVARIKQVVANMKFSTFREMAKRDLEEIEKNSSQ